MKKGSGASQPVKQSVASDNSRSFISERSEASENTQHHVEQKGSKVKKFSYTGGVAEAEEYSSSSKVVSTTEKVTSGKTTNVCKEWEQRLEKNVVGQQTNAADFTAQFLTAEEKTSKKETMYQKQENLSFPELEQMSTQPPPALPPKTKIKHSPSRNIFSPTDSLENAGTGTASIKSVEFIPVKEKVKLIAAQQEELLRKEERGTKTTSETHKSRGVRILPPSPVTVRKMSVEEELHHYDSDVTRSTPTIAFMETPPPRPELPDMPMYQFQEVKQSSEAMRKETGEDYSTLDSGLSHSVASYQQSSQQQSSSMQMSSSEMTSSHVQEMSSQQTSSFSEQQTYSSTSSYTTQKSSRAQVPGWSDSPVLSLDEQRQKEEVLMKAGSKLGVDSALDQLVAETESLTSQETLLFQQEQKTQQMQSSSSVTTQIDSTAVTNESFSASLKGSRGAESPAEECRRSFEEAELEAMALETHSNASLSKQSSIVESASVQSFVFHKEEKSESESSFRSRKPLKSASTAFVLFV